VLPIDCHELVFNTWLAMIQSSNLSFISQAYHSANHTGAVDPVVVTFPAGQTVNLESLFPLVDKHVRVQVDISAASSSTDPNTPANERVGVLWSVDTQARTVLLLQSNRSCSCVNADTIRRVETCTPPASLADADACSGANAAAELMAKLGIQAGITKQVCESYVCL
jgi:hypothetical protein